MNSNALNFIISYCLMGISIVLHRVKYTKVNKYKLNKFKQYNKLENPVKICFVNSENVMNKK